MKKKSSSKHESLPDSKIKPRMRELEKIIEENRHLYYVENKPLISDQHFDELFAELQTLEKKYPSFASPNSPTQSVGSDAESDFPKFRHTVPVLSLANSYSLNEAMEWADKLPDAKQLKFNVQWKVDGATLVLYYQKGNLVRAVTRGTGQIGDEITWNAKQIHAIPHRLKESVNVIVRGEAYMTYNDFLTFNEARGSIYANPRNLTSGSLKLKKSKEVKDRPIRWVAFDAHFEDMQFDSDQKQLNQCGILGLPLLDGSVNVSYSELKKSIINFTEKKSALNFPVDGLVIKVDSLNIREKLGFTSASPRWATALKFDPELAETVVEEIELSVGRTGRVTPKAKLRPVKLSGTTVTYATLHNAEYIQTLGVRKGSTVLISKRGEIIPAVEEVVDAGKEEAFLFPEFCPSCNTKLVKEKDAVDWLCPSNECPDKQIASIQFFASRKQMDIGGLGEKIVKNLYKENYIKTLPDIYRLHTHKETLENRPGFGKRSITLLLEEIEKSKLKPFSKLLPSIGLREMGTNVSEILIQAGYRSIESLFKLSEKKDALEELQNLEGIGPTTARYIVEQLQSKDVRAMIKQLSDLGLSFQEKEADKSDVLQIFQNQIWCITGSFANFQPREKVAEEIRLRGGKVGSSVSTNTTHLLAGEKAGSKLKKAESLNIHIVTEDEFMKLLEEPSPE